MRLFFSTVAAGIALVASIPLAGLAQQAPGPYHVLKIVKVGGDGGSDYVYADVDGRRLDIARTGQSPRMTVFDLDTFAPVGEIPNTSAHGAATDAQSHHAFASSSPVAMWDTKTTAPDQDHPRRGPPRRHPGRCVQPPRLRVQPRSAQCHRAGRQRRLDPGHN